MNIALEKQRRANNLSKHFKQQQQIVNPQEPQIVNLKPQLNKLPLIIQVRKQFQQKMDSLNLEKYFQGKDYQKQLIGVFILMSIYLTIFGYTMEFLDSYYFELKTIVVLILINGFHMIGLNLLNISSDPNKYLLNMLIVAVFEFVLLNYIIFGTLVAYLLKFLYVLSLMWNYNSPRQIKPPKQYNDCKNFTNCMKKGFAELYTLKKLLKRIRRFIIYILPLIALVMFIEYSYEQMQIGSNELLKLLFLEIFLMQQTEKLLRIISKYIVKRNLSQAVNQLAVFIYPLFLQNNRQQEIASLEYLKTLQVDNQIMKELLYFRLDYYEPVSILEIIISYFQSRIQDVGEDFIVTLQKSENFYKLQNRKYRLFEDLSILTRKLGLWHQKLMINTELKEKYEFYSYLFSTFLEFFNGHAKQYSVEIVRNNYLILQALQSMQNTSRNNPILISISKQIASESSRFCENNIFQFYLS